MTRQESWVRQDLNALRRVLAGTPEDQADVRRKLQSDIEEAEMMLASFHEHPAMTIISDIAMRADAAVLYDGLMLSEAKALLAECSQEIGRLRTLTGTFNSLAVGHGLRKIELQDKCDAAAAKLKEVVEILSTKEQ